MALAGEEIDVIVVGGGIIGSSTAYEVSKRGQKTLLLEQFDFLHQRGSFHGESRTKHATYPEDYYFPVIESYKLWQEAESQIGYKVYFKAGHLDMGNSHDKSMRGIINTCRKHSGFFFF
jgi:sarcosine oxidase/L-pipecolate oxidase